MLSITAHSNSKLMKIVTLLPNKTMKLIVAGSRNFNNYNLLRDSIFNNYKDIQSLEIVSGTARGADSLGEYFAKANNLILHQFPAEWDTYGKSAGFIRNKKMGDFADELLAFWDGRSRGTIHMIEYMWKLNKPVKIIRFD